MIWFDLAAASGLLPVGLLSLRSGYSRTLQANPVTYALAFPGDLQEEAVVRFLVSLTGLLPPWWRRWLAQPVVVVETVADGRGIRHTLTVPRQVASHIEAGLQAQLSGVRYERTDLAAPSPRLAAEYRLSSAARPLRVDSTGTSAGLLASLHPLHNSEQVVIQWLLTPSGPLRPPRLASADRGAPVLSDADLLSSAEAVSARKLKLRAPILLAVGRIGVQAASHGQAVELLRQVEGPLHGTRAPGVHLRRRLLPQALVAARLARRSVPLTRFPIPLNAEEAATVIGWPIGLTAVPGLSLGGCRLLPVSGVIPRRGTVLGTATFPGQLDRPLALDLESRFRPMSVTGPTGVGKSTLLAHIVLQDIRAGRGVVVLDPKGDVCRLVAERLPEHRLDDVIVLDAGTAGDIVVGYNPLRSATANPDLAVEQVLGVMRSIWRANWGPRTDELLRAALATLAAVGHFSLCELPAVLSDERFRRRLLATIQDPFGVEGIWATFDGWSEGERQAAVAPVLNKTRALTTRPRLRAVLGQVDGAVDFARIIAQRQILLVNLAAGTLGTEAAYLLGALLFAGLWVAVTARGHQPTDQRIPIMAVIDEFQHVVALPTPAETLLAEARSYKLSLTLAHQHLGQLDHDLEHAVLANARNKVVFQTSRADAATFAKELGGGLTPEDLMGIAAHEAVVSAMAAGRVQPPAIIRTLPLGPALRTAESVFEYSAKRWGKARAEVDAELAERLQPPKHGGQPRVGRTPRRDS